MTVRYQLRKTALESKYLTDFPELCDLVHNRAEKGFFNTQGVYSKSPHNEQMVRDFHNHFLYLNCSVQTGWIDGFPFIDIWWN